MESTFDGAKDPLDEAGRSSSAGLHQYAASEGHYVTQKINYKSFWNPDTYDLAGGLALEGHSSSPTLALAELSGGWVLPLLDPSASPVGEAFLFLSPSSGRESSFSSSSLGKESASEPSDDESDIT